ncbi:hypothetical protein [Vibrio breoganii]|uniref:hypothetical protein n=1 Tax=Vibrio breoganii TaxID=553239 RepID=UPI000C814F4C|nr:hypothetical protein [Vibrio breoganii]PMO34031.1 hypothetical protein BCT12_01485 [Vibrio breoganii]
MKLSVLISTYGNRAINLDKLIKEEKDDVVYLIAHQNSKGNEIDSLFANRVDVKYYKIDSTGVTSSRNFLLNKCESDIGYFCDDDITLINNFDEVILNSHYRNDSSIITFSINDELGIPRKKYYANRYRNKFNILSIGTIEVSFKVKDIKGHVFFPENMGCGTNIPIGDEAVFAKRVLSKKMKIYDTGLCIASHPLESSGRFITDSSIYARGYTLSLVYGLILALFLSIPFYLIRSKLFNSNVRSSGTPTFLLFIKGVLRMPLN